MGIAAMVLGIVGLLFSFIPCLGMYAAPVTLLAVILGAIGMRKPQGKGMAIAGLTCGALGCIISAYWIYVWVTFDGSKFAKEIEEHQEKFREHERQRLDENGKPTRDKIDKAVDKALDEAIDKVKKDMDKDDTTQP